MITINFEETYDPVTMEMNLSEMIFISPQVGGAEQELLIKISPHPDPYLPGVFNLGFGPPSGPGAFLDNVRLKHTDVNKVFSTILLHALILLQSDPDLTLGLDGSDDIRAALYHKMIRSNRAYLEGFFVVNGVDWYIRVFRNLEVEVDENGDLLSKPRPEPFDYKRDLHDLYRYYIFRLR